MADEQRNGHDDAYSIYDDAWYVAIDRLRAIADSGTSDGDAIRASEVLLEYSKHFTILGAPYVPFSELPKDIQERLNNDD